MAYIFLRALPLGRAQMGLAHTHMEVGDNLRGSKFFSSTMWDPRIVLMFSSLAVGTFAY